MLHLQGLLRQRLLASRTYEGISAEGCAKDLLGSVRGWYQGTQPEPVHTSNKLLTVKCNSQFFSARKALKLQHVCCNTSGYTDPYLERNTVLTTVQVLLSDSVMGYWSKHLHFCIQMTFKGHVHYGKLHLFLMSTCTLHVTLLLYKVILDITIIASTLLILSHTDLKVV